MWLCRFMKSTFCAMAFTEHMMGLAITRQVYMNAKEITALQARLRKQHWDGTFDILDVCLREERQVLVALSIDFGRPVQQLLTY